MTKNETMRLALDALSYAADEIWCENDDDIIADAVRALRTALAQPDARIGITYEEANPPQLHCERCGKKLGIDVNDIHTCTPMRKEWVGLTAYEVQELHTANKHFGAFACAIETKLKEKNETT